MTETTEWSPTIFKAPTEAEVAELVTACKGDPDQIARRLAFQHDRLLSAIEGKQGWKEEYTKLKDAAQAMIMAWDSHHLSHYQACAKNKMGPHFSSHLEALEELKRICAQ